MDNQARNDKHKPATEYTIKKNDIERLDITLEDREKLLRLLSKFDQ